MPVADYYNFGKLLSYKSFYWWIDEIKTLSPAVKCLTQDPQARFVDNGYLRNVWELNSETEREEKLRKNLVIVPILLTKVLLLRIEQVSTERSPYNQQSLVIKLFEVVLTDN